MEIVTKIAPIALALIMLGLGLGLTKQDFTRVIKTPKDFLLVIFSFIRIIEIRKIKIGASVVMIALFIGVELYSP